MKIADILLKSEKPTIYEKGNSFMWTDEHISKQLLDIHLNPEIDLGSRKMSTIQKTANWILNLQNGKSNLEILDLGCGPGLYSEIFAKKGHRVTGVDISKNSIDYAQKTARDKGLDIEYINASYLELEFEKDKYDLIVLIYTDLGVLTPYDRNRLLKTIYKTLKKGGIFIFDVLKDNSLEQKITPKTWEVAKSGFWKNCPYVALSESFLYKEQKVILYQHLIIDCEDTIETYRFWTHFFNQEELKFMLEKHGFATINHRDDILPKGDIWNGENVIFTLASKI
ncbi:methyltransferase domain-containing protein [Prolixibacteraceae bacterium Z1-6]|uniref:Methyltransferase domain-containing protein n=1 Tax=Draconibacterium aestuarii TaxID=2998507 RepID=A0A9X3J6N3_9BACT|nr:methyltransferase domain-containing protein [Prolixibacteraceae bacterium Z1-6]